MPEIIERITLRKTFLSSNSHYLSQKNYWDRVGLRNVRDISILYGGNTYQAHMNEPKGRIKFNDDLTFERFKRENGISEESVGMEIEIIIRW